jgi:hypothetical protein
MSSYRPVNFSKNEAFWHNYGRVLMNECCFLFAKGQCMEKCAKSFPSSVPIREERDSRRDKFRTFEIGEYFLDKQSDFQIVTPNATVVCFY